MSSHPEPGVGAGAAGVDPSDAETKTLRERVKAESKQLLSDLSAEPSSSTLSDRIGRLKDLDWLADRVSPQGDGKKRWPAVLISALTSALLAILFGTPASTTVSVDAVTRSVEFLLPRLAEGGEFASIFARLQVQGVEFEGSVQAVPKSAPVRVEARGGTIEAAAGTHLKITQFFVTHNGGKDLPMVTLTSESAQELRICATNAKLTLDIVASSDSTTNDKSFLVHVNALMPPGRETAAPPCAVLQTGAPVVRQQLMGNMRASHLNVSGPAYRPQGNDDQADVFPSELKSAKVAFVDAPGTRALIEEEQRLNLTAFNGKLRRVYWVKDRLQVQANGTVDGVTRSIAETYQDLMPKRITLLRTKYSDLWVAWGLLLYLLGIALSLLKWYGAKV